MTRGPTILAAVAALAVSSAAAASKQGVIVYNGHAGLGANFKALTGTEPVGGRVTVSINASGGWDPTLRAARARGDRVT